MRFRTITFHPQILKLISFSNDICPVLKWSGNTEHAQHVRMPQLFLYKLCLVRKHGHYQTKPTATKDSSKYSILNRKGSTWISCITYFIFCVTKIGLLMQHERMQILRDYAPILEVWNVLRGIWGGCMAYALCQILFLCP